MQHGANPMCVFGCVFWRPNIIVLCVQKPKRKMGKDVGRGEGSSSLITNTNTHKYLSSAPLFSSASKTCMCGVKDFIVFWLLNHFVLPFLFPLSSIFSPSSFLCFCFLSCHSCSLWHHSLCSFSALLFILLFVGLLSIILHSTFVHSCCTFSCSKLLIFLFDVVVHSFAQSHCSSYSMLLHILLLQVIVLHIRCYFMFLSRLFV